jgi:hypothetical protein
MRPGRRFEAQIEVQIEAQTIKQQKKGKVMPSLCIRLALAGLLLGAHLAADAAGAIAKGDGTRTGYAHSFSNTNQASQRALNECGAGCKVVVTFDTGCAALAMDRNSTAFGAGRGANRAAAENYAMGFCRQYGGKSCYVRTWTCAERPCEYSQGVLSTARCPQAARTGGLTHRR